MNERPCGAGPPRTLTLPAGPTGMLAALTWLTLAATAAAASPGAQPTLLLRKHDRVALVGGALAERMNRGGHFETLLHARFAPLELTVRNFGWPGDEVGCQQRPADYAIIDDPQQEDHADAAVTAPTDRRHVPES